MLLRHPSLIVALLLAVSPFGRAASAQSSLPPVQTAPERFSLRGKVLDAVGASVVGARITAVSGGNLASASAVSDQNGRFTLVLGAGRYIITVTADGFMENTQTVNLPQTGPSLQEFILQVAGVRETVNVSASAGYQVSTITSGTKTPTPLRDVPQSVAIVTKDLIRDQLMTSLGDVVRYVPGISGHQGENNRDQVIIRGNNSSADFFLDGVRDDVQYYRNLYNLERVEALKGPNAMMFGRGGGGGVINRVSKEAGFTPLRELTLVGGSFSTKRFAIDLNQPVSDTVAARVNAIYENSDSFRQFVNLERYGVNPTLTIAPSPQTKITLGYEHFHDARMADRGVPSLQGRPADVNISTYFGNPDDSHVRARVDLASATIAHQRGALGIRNRTLLGDYDRGYQNFVPGSVTTDKTEVVLTAYNNATKRLNLFNQADLTYSLSTGRLRHTLLAGIEVGRQLTENFRNTGYFNNATTSTLVPYNNPTTSTPVTFRQSATDADNHLETNVAAAYGQDQVELSRFVQAIAGLRFDYFDLQYHNNRKGDGLARIDYLASPRLGMVVKPVTSASIYGSYSVSHLPSSGDQFSSLTSITRQVEPERFNNYEVGAKWDIHRDLSLTTAVYRLDRTNTRATDPNDPTRIVQTGRQRTNGWEIGINGRLVGAWQIAGGYAYQDAFVTSATAAAPPGAQVAQVPHHAASLWNTYQFLPRIGAGLGIVHRTEMYAGIDNTVTLPGYIEAATALYVAVTERLRLQANVNNVFNRQYYVNADSNTNISPGAPRAFRIALTARF